MKHLQILSCISLLALQVTSFSPPGILQCWDGIFDDEGLATVSRAGAARSHSFTSVFNRQDPPRSVIESAIVSILDEFNNSSAVTNNSAADDECFAEYWWRDGRARMLEAHRDIDEMLCRRNQVPVALGSSDKIGLQVCPSFGHVLYVNVESVCAPTVLWQEEGLAGGGPPRKLNCMWTVPARCNRLLRFRGDCLHGVSYPPLAFLGMNHDSISDHENQRRDVLLFNTWRKPPLYPGVAEPLSAIEATLMESQSLVKCNPRTKWCPTRVMDKSIINVVQDDTSLLSVPLLGSFYRRGTDEDTLTVRVNNAAATRALSSSFEIHAVELQDQ